MRSNQYIKSRNSLAQGYLEAAREGFRRFACTLDGYQMSGMGAEWQDGLADHAVAAEDLQSEDELVGIPSAVELVAAARTGEYGFMGATLLRRNQWFKDAVDSRRVKCG
jgi:hypothetical protein